jgi:hypothetical protein
VGESGRRDERRTDFNPSARNATSNLRLQRSRFSRGAWTALSVSVPHRPPETAVCGRSLPVSPVWDGSPFSPFAPFACGAAPLEPFDGVADCPVCGRHDNRLPRFYRLVRRLIRLHRRLGSPFDPLVSVAEPAVSPVSLRRCPLEPFAPFAGVLSQTKRARRGVSNSSPRPQRAPRTPPRYRRGQPTGKNSSGPLLRRHSKRQARYSPAREQPTSSARTLPSRARVSPRTPCALPARPRCGPVHSVYVYTIRRPLT